VVVFRATAFWPSRQSIATTPKRPVRRLDLSFAYNFGSPAIRSTDGKHYNYFRDYDPAIGRYIQSDPTGVNAGLNTYAYALASPLLLRDVFGLTASDVQGVFRDVGRSFGDLRPGTNEVSFEPGGPGTDKLSAQIHIDPSWASKACLTKDEYRELFFTLFHEAMHSSDDLWTRLQTRNSLDDKHHESIYQREVYEGGRGARRKKPSNMWGIARDKPLDMDQLYRDYRGRTPACCPIGGR
jgi:RHS repeat-associated protein